ncbi:DUF2243 domain-containing protein [Paracoccus sp. Z118]|uniref:DUF2243 domain-containing protein n=1 Tax=Paracoccus sp. Z118 TaxID=2851017 RepID=UPI001C2C9280|nr:DUF2243 domain-containing protein [Paracoccus sp. Z118]MBV0891112.1 DUF2243 domain-containing protein [Paracoccus sp. Z118]
MWTSRWTRPGIVLGFALGGFFDGILLHQILQWHHLLSLVPGIGDLRLQVLWDGWFHALMYVIAAAGLCGLWRAQRRGAALPGRQLSGALLVGFGLWHMTDGILSHWLLGIHRIRLDSPNPLAWDLLFFIGAGIMPALAGWLMIRGGGAPRLPAPAALAVLTILTGGMAAWTLRAPPDRPFTTVVFRPGASSQQVMAALVAQDARLVWSDTAGGVIVVDVAPADRWGFYARGALLVSGSGVPAGCIDWSRA